MNELIHIVVPAWFIWAAVTLTAISLVLTLIHLVVRHRLDKLNQEMSRRWFEDNE